MPIGVPARASEAITSRLPRSRTSVSATVPTASAIRRAEPRSAS